MPLVGNLYPNSGNRSKRVEILGSAFGKSLPKQRKSVEKVENPSAAVRISLPKQRKSAKKVEIPRATGRISLPKQRKSAEKVEIPKSRRSHISTQTAEIGRKGRDSQVPQVAYLYPNSENRSKR